MGGVSLYIHWRMDPINMVSEGSVIVHLLFFAIVIPLACTFAAFKGIFSALSAPLIVLAMVTFDDKFSCANKKVKTV